MNDTENAANSRKRTIGYLLWLCSMPLFFYASIYAKQSTTAEAAAVFAAPVLIFIAGGIFLIERRVAK